MNAIVRRVSCSLPSSKRRTNCTSLQVLGLYASVWRFDGNSRRIAVVYEKDVGGSWEENGRFVGTAIFETKSIRIDENRSLILFDPSADSVSFQDYRG